MTHSLSILIFVGQVSVLVTVQVIAKAAGWKNASNVLSRNIRQVILYAFLLENGIEFWSALLLSLCIPAF